MSHHHLTRRSFPGACSPMARASSLLGLLLAPLLAVHGCGDNSPAGAGVVVAQISLAPVAFSLPANSRRFFS